MEAKVKVSSNLMCSFMFATIVFLANIKMAVAESTTPILNCWDGTFAYGSFSIIKRASDRANVSGIEVGISTQFAHDKLEFTRHSFHDSIVINPYQDLKLYAKFPSDACIVEGNEVENIRVTCELLNARHPLAKVFIPRTIRDLGEYKSGLISDLPVDKLTLTVEEGNAKLKIFGANDSDNQDDIQIITINGRHCNTRGETRSGGTHWGLPPFPERVNRYLSTIRMD